MLATQIEVSDGTLNIINVGIESFEQDDISVSLDQSETPLVEGVGYIWSAATTIQFLNTVNTPGGLVPNGVEVILRRDTKTDAVYNVYDGGAPFSRLTLDENFEQLLRLAQEYSEGLGLDGLRNNLSMNGYRVTNLGSPVAGGDATNKGYVDVGDVAAKAYADVKDAVVVTYVDAQNNLQDNVITAIQTDLTETVRGVPGEVLTPLPPAVSRANKVMGFDSLGNPIGIVPATGSGTELAIDLANATDPAKGSAMVAFFQNLVGSVARTVRAKLLDYLSQKDFGAVGDNVADDRDALNAALSSSKDILSTSGTYKATNTVTFGAATYRAGRLSVHNNSAGFSYRLGIGSDIDGGTWNASGGVAFDLLAAAEDVSLRNLKISNTSVSNATAVNVSAVGVKNLRIHGAAITAKGFGVLTNSGGTIDGMIVSASCISSEADPIELNAPGVSHKNIAVIGNVLRANGPGVGHTSGFAVGVAAAKNVAIVGNVIPESTWEAIHVEDQQDTLTVTGNSFENLKGDCVRASVDGFGGTGGKGFPIIGNNAKSYASGLANYGAYMVFTANGSLPGMTVMGNRFSGFEAGIRGGRGNIIANGNVLDSCGLFAVRSDGGGFMYGTNLAVNTPALVKSTEGTLIGRVVSDTVPATILDTSGHVANTIGTVLEEGFAFRGLTSTLTGGSTTTAINLFALPKLMRGRLIVRVRQVGSSAYIYASADVTWDGTTLTVANALKDQAGPFAWSGTTFTAAGGQIQMSIFNTGGGVNTLEDVIFKGEYYK